MNTESIVNKTPRIFPYYKDVYLGKEPEGYSTISGARKFMWGIPAKDVYAEYYGSKKEYERTHYYFYGVDDNYIEFTYNNPSNNPEFKRYDIYKKVKVKDLKYDLDEVLDAISKVNLHSTNIDVDAAIEFEKKYGLYPDVFVDDSDFRRSYSKYITKYVEFREGIVEMYVKWKDGTVTPAPTT